MIGMKVTKHRKARFLRHKIHMPDGVWTYQIASGGATIRSPGCDLTGKISMPDLTGMHPDTYEKDVRKGGGPQVKPSDIRSFIEKIKKGEYEIVTTSTLGKKKRAQMAKRQTRMPQKYVFEGSNPSLGI